MNYYYARRYDEAIAQMRRTVEMDPGYYFAHMNLGEPLAAKGDFRKASALNDDPYASALLSHTYARSGNKAEALRILNQIKMLSQQRYVPISSQFKK